ncbi:MAG: hypothetical protein RIQ59_1268 [Bacteroidota bacterium]
MIQLVHIINPVKVNKKSDLFTAQPITFGSMIGAKNHSKYSNQILQCTTQYEEDVEFIPAEFTKLSNLDRSVIDVNSSLNGRKLPLIKDILQKTQEVENCDYCVYTNVDIALMPQFYDVVFYKINKGHDAIVINRRRLKNDYSSVDELPLMYSDFGKSHPGFDCFVFKKELLNSFILDEICVGIPFLEATLVHNIFSFANNPLFIPDAHLTFHIGMDVMANNTNAYYEHNRKVFFKSIYPKLKPHFSLNKFPYGSLNFPNRMMKWALNPSLFTLNYLNLEKKNAIQKAKLFLDEIRWRLLQK